MLPAEGHLKVHDDRQLQQQLDPVYGNQHAKGHLGLLVSNRQVTTIKHPVEKHFQVFDCNNTSQIPAGISKITELTLDLFGSNYHLYARKISCPEEGFFIRAVLMKNNVIIFNYSYKIIGTENVRITTIVSADQVCNHYLQLATKGDTFLVSLGNSIV